VSHYSRLSFSVRLADFSYVNHPKLASIYSAYKFAESAPTYTPPQKEAKAKAPKAEAAEKPKAEKKPKAKEVDEDEEEPLVPEEPKVKNPLDDLPKSSFNLEEWKRQYSNLDTRSEALPWFYEK
jgi:elongation factor 1-gamma